MAYAIRTTMAGAASKGKRVVCCLPQTLKLARERNVYSNTEPLTDDHPVLKSFINFVELCEQQERATGEPVTIEASY